MDYLVFSSNEWVFINIYLFRKSADIFPFYGILYFM
jgi:hypothetical protein